ncbi:MAG: hypothetical protein MJ072_06170, partial [Clostridia bacterium]|nr:hypothetical protein [Clostridia bacterium]
MDDLDVVVTSNAEKEYGTNRIISATESEKDAEFENVLRPKSMDGYIGQERVKDNGSAAITASTMSGEVPDHRGRDHRDRH